MRTIRHAGMAMLVLVAGGCGEKSGRHPVAGRVTLADGNTTHLAGHAVEAALTSDPKVRAAGILDAEGRFALQTLEGRLQTEAPAGRYEVRIVIQREGDGRDPKPPVAPRFQDFKKSGLTLDVPSNSEVRLTVSAK